MAELTIITQNLNGYNYRGLFKEKLDWTIWKRMIDRYMKEHEADIYAFQEFYETESSTSFNAKTIVKPPFCEGMKGMNVSGRAEEIWDETFPWAEFRSGYWDERDIKFAGETIKIINFHSSPTYDLGIRYILLKRLSEVKGRFTIVLGDFNAAFLGQMANKEKKFIRSAMFLEKITNSGFRECLEQETENGLHHTHSYGKIDHIFISESLFNLLRDSNPEKDKEKPYEITYIHEVRRNHPSKSKDAFTNHSGIKLTIWLPDPE